MSGRMCRSACRGWWTCPLIALTVLIASLLQVDGAAQTVETVRISAPPTLLFEVPDVSVATLAVGSPATVSFDLAVLRPGHALRIQVKADSDLSPPQGPSIPATALSWTASGAVNGIGVNGVLAKNQYRTVYESQAGAVSGRVDLVWTISNIAKNVRAGTHQVTVRWRLETFTP